ncbi:MAG: DUF2510 domain-containing protein [Microthrixaceae bacterium]
MRTRGRTVRVAALVLLVGAVPVLAGCLRAEASITVRDDRSATVELQTVADATEVAALGGEAGIQQLARLIDGLPGDVEAQVVERRGLPGLEITIELDDVAALATPLTSPARPGATARFFNRFDLTETPDGWLLAAEAVPLQQVVAGAAVPLALADARYELSITLPGNITGTNAKDQEKGTGYWTVRSAPQPISMRTRTGTTINPVLVVVGVAFGVILLGILIAVWAREASVRRRLRKQAAATIAAGSPGSWAPRSGDAPPRSAGGAATPAASVEGMYPEIHDGSVAVPVGGSAWGPPPSAPGSSAAPAAGAAAPSSAMSEVPPEPTAAPEHPAAPEPTAAVAATAPVAPLVPPGWYDDPDRPGGHRYWDGTNWTEHRT